MQATHARSGSRHGARRHAWLACAIGALPASVARAAMPPAPLPDPASAARALPCPELPPQPTEAELAAARSCAALASPTVPAPGGSGSGSASPGGSGTPNMPLQPGPKAGLQGPFVVHQTQTLHRESISGSACDEATPFDVHFVTPPATFDTHFVPDATTGQPGQWSYAYTIPRAGESHAAQGTYTLQADVAAHALHLAMTGSDHVVFNGFDGNMPIDYQFDLVATPGAPCSTPR